MTRDFGRFGPTLISIFPYFSFLTIAFKIEVISFLKPKEKPDLILAECGTAPLSTFLFFYNTFPNFSFLFSFLMFAASLRDWTALATHAMHATWTATFLLLLHHVKCHISADLIDDKQPWMESSSSRTLSESTLRFERWCIWIIACTHAYIHKTDTRI